MVKKPVKRSRLRTGANSQRTGANGPRRKQGPRGKPFPRGNDAGKKFQPGETGNPGGRPRRTMAEFREMFSEGTEQVLRALRAGAVVGLARGTTAGVAAAHEFLDRMWGRAPQPITGGDGGPVKVTYELVRSKLEEIAKGAAAEAARTKLDEIANAAAERSAPAEGHGSENENDAGDEPPADPDPESA